MKFYFDTINDLNLVPPALIVANYKSREKISTSKLISEIRSISEIPNEDKQILKDRSDDKFSQKVRNLISHKILEKYNLAILSKNNIELTKHGKNIGNLIRENFIGDKINIKKIIQNDKYQRSLLQAKLDVNFDILFLMKLVSCDFSKRTLGIFKYFNFTYVGDLVTEISEKDLLKAPNAGSKSIFEIKDFLSKNNLTLNMKSSWSQINDKKSLYLTYINHISKNFSNHNIDDIISKYLTKYKKESDIFFDRRKKIIKLRLALEGNFTTLDKLGKEFKIERERVRQIQSQFCKKISDKEDFKFALKKLILFLSSNTPIGEKLLNNKLINENFFNSYKSIPALRSLISGFTKFKYDNFALNNNLYYSENTIETDEKSLHDEEFLISSKKEIKDLNTIVSESRKLTTRFSFCNFNKLINNIFKTKKYSNFDNIKNSLQNHSNFIWFDDDNFMTLDTSGQTIIKRLNKLLFIHKKISFDNFLSALMNDNRIRTSPPLNIMKKICEFNNLKSDDNFIYFKGVKPEFNNLENKLIKLFKENGDYLTIWECVDLIEKYEINIGSLMAYLYGSYLIKKIDKIFVLSGTEIENNKLTDAKDRSEREKKDNDPNVEVDWGLNKKIEVKLKLTKAILAQGFIYIPTQWHEIIEGNYYNFENKLNVRVSNAIWDLKQILKNHKLNGKIILEFSFSPNTIKVKVCN